MLKNISIEFWANLFVDRYRYMYTTYTYIYVYFVLRQM